MSVCDLIASCLWFVLVCVFPAVLVAGLLIVVSIILSMVSRKRDIDRMHSQRRAGVEPSQPWDEAGTRNVARAEHFSHGIGGGSKV